MAEHIPYINPVEVGQSRVPSRQKEITPFMDKIAARLEKYRVAEIMGQGLLEGLGILDANDAVLDLKGKQLLLDRDIFETEEYRAALLARIPELGSKGDPESLIQIIKAKLSGIKVVYHGGEETGELDNILYVSLDSPHKPGNMPSIMESMRNQKKGGQGIAVVPLDPDHWCPEIHPMEASGKDQPFLMFPCADQVYTDCQVVPIAADYFEGAPVLPVIGEDYTSTPERFTPHLYRPE